MGRKCFNSHLFDDILKYPYNRCFDIEEDIHFLTLWEKLDAKTRRAYICRLIEEQKKINVRRNKTDNI